VPIARLHHTISAHLFGLQRGDRLPIQRRGMRDQIAAASDQDFRRLVGSPQRDRRLEERDRIAPTALFIGVQPCFIGLHPGGYGLTGKAEQLVDNGRHGRDALKLETLHMTQLAGDSQERARDEPPSRGPSIDCSKEEPGKEGKVIGEEAELCLIVMSAVAGDGRAAI
jgi:hypothetical protein